MIEFELALAANKWFAYRFMTPMQATELFAEKYAEEFPDTWSRTWDYKEAELKRALPKDGLRAPGELAAMWRARQMADALGMKYEVFLGIAMRFFEVRTYRRPPRPNQMYGEKVKDHLMAFARREWVKRLEGGLDRYSSYPAYRNEVFLGLPAQIDHHEFVLRAIRGFHTYPDGISTLHFRLRLIPLKNLEGEFDAAHIDEARRLAASRSNAPVALLTEEQMRPACFGLLSISGADGTDCGRCPIREACKQECDIVDEVLVRKYGCVHPHDESRRKRTRERVRRHRARKRGAAAGT